jgi:hypothetical protein
VVPVEVPADGTGSHPGDVVSFKCEVVVVVVLPLALRQVRADGSNGRLEFGNGGGTEGGK